MTTNTEIIDLHTAIISALKTAYPNYTVDDYVEDDNTIDATGLYINLVGFERSKKGGVGKPLHLNCKFELYICLYFTETNYKLALRQLTADLIALINGNRWNNKAIEGAVFQLASEEQFNPKFNGYEAWKIEFEQNIRIGSFS